jgi:hypothetical protein
MHEIDYDRPVLRRYIDAVALRNATADELQDRRRSRAPVILWHGVVGCSN